MNPLAIELNAELNGTAAGRLMSKMGSRLYFPKGIIAQSAEAKKSAHAANATIGMAYSKGLPLILSSIVYSMPTLTPEQAVAYAPTAGVEKVRQDWKKLIAQKNPSLNPQNISLPVVVPGLTAGISYMADLFLEEGGVMLASDPCWDNYQLVFEERRNARLKGIPFFSKDSIKASRPGLDLEAINKAVKEEAKTGAVRIILNFPNNPSGYSPTKAEYDGLTKIFKEAAEAGADVLVLCDDAYFGLFYENDIYQESIFSALAGLHEKVLAVKIDGPIKEDYVWGLRTGFVTFGSKGLGSAHYDALVKKLMGAIRSSVSCANTPAQYLIIQAMEDPRTISEKARFQDMMLKRYQAVKQFVVSHPNHPNLTPLPFNSGYFMSFRTEGVSAEKLRQELLARHGIGVVSLGESCLRVAFAGLDEEIIESTYKVIYDTAEGMGKGKV
ncbi:aminotransferase class I/II-fold pyridoxal phosphate-dependent enzyme [Leadbettera azotonutricia]|uniref:Aspartate aminotransferase n=1 Tax=Leadbettera azotonutricia (strain ATCC BAA-888 / DSM 13862 / ZAS-9) TaxID=545695 RepID=F5Y7R3_LEAAZ|nr:aminotransferase class I/II-fold pyridoxal phosphate-dependent enzyme [Leadbettera azotonutricia]AEF82461.1 aspartate aminotransferase [Leadbettera azotonutricia ZAS-9]